MQCTGHRRDGKPCTNPPIRGATVCRMHGGAAPKVRAKAAVRAAVIDMGFDDVTAVDPGEILLRLLALAASRVDTLAAEYESLVAQCGLHDATVGTATVVGDDGATHAGREYIRALADAEFRERRMCADLAFKAKAANLGERELRLAQRTGATIAEVLRAFLGDPDLGLTPAQRAAAPGALRRYLGLAGPPADDGEALDARRARQG